MFNKSNLKVAAVAALAVMTLALALWPKAALADFPYNHMSHDSCVVNSEYWGGYSGDWDLLTFPRALYHANISTGPDVACSKEIAIAEDKIVMTRPIEIQANGDSDNPFVIRGGGCGTLTGDHEEVCPSRPYNGRTVFEVHRDFPRVSGGCVIKITGNSVMLQDIKVTNVPDGMKAICVRGDNAILDSVVVESSSGDAFVFDDGASGFVTFYSGANNVDGNVIDFGEVSGDYLSPNVVFQAVDPSADLPDTNANGLQIPPSDAQTFSIENSEVSRYFRNNSPLQVCVKNKMESNNVITIRGWVKEVSEDNEELRDACISDRVVRLQIWDRDGFHGYVGPWNSVSRAGMGTNTADGRGVMRGHTGYFNFKLPESNGDIILVPEDSAGRVGRPSGVIRVSAGSGECVDEELGDDTCGDTGPDRPDPDDDFNGFKSIGECLSARGIIEQGESGSELGDVTIDTDGDGISDDAEDYDYDCKCDRINTGDGHDETCWYNPDTDKDGLTDFVEGAVSRKTPAARAYAIKSDRDNDGLKDGEEDRNQLIYRISASGTSNMPNYLYEYQTTWSSDPVTSGKGGEYEECDLGQEFSKIGVRYRWYIQRSGQPLRAFGGDFPEDAVDGTLKLYVCRNASLGESTNFDGQYNSDLELKIGDVDTDGDEWCDGPGSGCAAPATEHGANAADNCPLIPNELGVNDCKRQYPCSPNQMFYGVDRRYVNWNGGDPTMRDGLPGKAANAVQPDGSIAGNGVADVLEVTSPCTTILTLCADIDDDGIPDCVENPSGQCSGECGSDVRPSSGDSVGLRHYCADTDDDGKIDGWKGAANSDVCPVTRGTNDAFTENGTYSCRTEDFYVARPVIACFLDRDGDSLWDAMEDKNRNGRYDAIVSNIAGIGTTESNALSKDSDGDTIMDNDEVNGWGGEIATNPSDANSDDDGIDDNLENRDGVPGFQVTMLEGMGCAASIGKDTNPALFDTDGDTLGDGAEVDGAIPSDSEFMRLIGDPASWTSGGLVIGSSPLAKDSDADRLDDNAEYNGDRVTWYDSNPCMRDSDGDSRIDRDELRGCRLNPDARCVGSADGGTGGGMDSDEDGLPNDMERALGTNENLPDTDGDDVWDGMEDSNHNGIYEQSLGESDPMNPDTDGDGMNDGMEVRYGTDFTNSDTDGDCIPDGIEDSNPNGIFDSTETCAAVVCTSPDGATVNGSDTDGDGLPDGRIRGIGEDMGGQEGATACNGIRDVAPDGGFLETDPTNPNSDYEGGNDRDEMFEGGSFNVANSGRANNGSEGCSMMGAAGKAPTSMYYLLGLVLFATRVARRKLQGS